MVNGVAPDQNAGGPRHPRTAVAFNDEYVFFVVVDGRSLISIGMTIAELGDFCVKHLGAVQALALDGGGSSTMVVNGAVKNKPSDGGEERVANGLLLAFVSPAVVSSRFHAGERLRTTTATDLRLGPGTNYGVAATAPQGSRGLIAVHSFNGIHAKGVFWWKCSFDDKTGWAPEDCLESASSPRSAE